MQIDFYNPRSIVLFICILQGAIFAVLLIHRATQKKSPADFWLAALIVSLCLSLVTPLIGFANVYNLNQWLTYFPFGIAYSYGVCVYLYTVSLTDAKRRFGRGDLFLFIPSAIYLIFRLTLFSQSLEFKDWFDKNYYVPVASPVIFVTEFLWNAWLLCLAIRHYRKYRAWLDENFSDTEKIKFDWLKNFLYVLAAVLLTGALFDFTNSFVADLSYIQYFYFEFVLALVTYYLAIAGYLRSETIELNFTAPESAKLESRRTLLPENELENLKFKLQSLMLAEKPFLNSQLTLVELSRKLAVNSTILSYVINTGFGKNFNDFVNEYRVGEVKKKLQNAPANNLNLLDLAFDCGFNSKATFNRAFKKFAGMSPKEFQDSAATVSK